MESTVPQSWKVLAQEKGGGKVVAEYLFAVEEEAKLFQKDMKYKGYKTELEHIIWNT